MNNQICFRFTDGTLLSVEFKKIRTTKAAQDVAQYIARKMELRGAIRNSKAAKYFKKSQILPFRKFYVDFFQNGKLFKSCYMNVESQAGLASDYDAILEMIETMFAEASLGTPRTIVS